MATLVTRSGKGSALTWSEGDANFTNLNDVKIEAENTGTADQVLTRTSTGAAWADASAAGLTAVVDDTTPQLGGNLNTNGFAIIDDTLINLQGGAADSITLGGGAINIKPNIGTNTKIELQDSAGFGNITLLANGVISVTTTDTINIAATALKLNNLTYPTADGTTGQVLATDGAGVLNWVTGGGGGLTALVDDTTPTLGGMLNTNGYAIANDTSMTIQAGAADSISLGGGGVTIRANGDNTKIVLQESSGFGNITLLANGVIDISTTDTLDMSATTLKLNNLTFPVADGTANQVLTTDGAGVLSWSTVSGGGGGALDDLTDVIITTATTDDVLVYNGTEWVNSPVLGDIQTALTEIIG